MDRVIEHHLPFLDSSKLLISLFVLPNIAINVITTPPFPTPLGGLDEQAEHFSTTIH